MKRFVTTAVIAMLVCLSGGALAAKTPAPLKARVAPTASATSLISVDRAAAAREGISADVLNLALEAVSCGVASCDLQPPPTLTVIDYSLPSTTPRLWVVDLHTGKILFHELVAHGRNSGDNMATRFSDAMDSKESSLGLFRTADTYVGHNGYSLRLDGLEPGFNGNARDRAIVMHAAAYVNDGTAKVLGRLGRSFGCPALSEAVARNVIDTVRGGGIIFSYYPDPTWLKESKFLNCAAMTAPATVATH